MQITLPRKKVLFSILFVIVIIFGVLLWLNWPFQQYDGFKMSPKWDISDNIITEPTDRIFASGIYNTGYNVFLHDKGPFTVFVPVDKSYNNLSATTKDSFMNKDNIGSLRQMLLYHVVKGEYRYADLRDGMKLKTLEGEELTFTKKGNFFVINGYSYIQTPDLVSKNGVIHMTTNYLIPPSMIN